MIKNNYKLVKMTEYYNELFVIFKSALLDFNWDKKWAQKVTQFEKLPVFAPSVKTPQNGFSFPWVHSKRSHWLVQSVV